MGFFSKLFGIPSSTDGASYYEIQNNLIDMATFTSIPPDGCFYYHREHCEFQISSSRKKKTTLSAGTFSMPSVSELRQTAMALQQKLLLLQGEEEEGMMMMTCDGENNEATSSATTTTTTTVTNMIGEARSLHTSIVRTENNDDDNNSSIVIIQAASQFNMLEMPAPHITPDIGIDKYEFDRTQGPACAMACVAGTTYRNYLVPIPFLFSPSVDDNNNERKKKRGQTKNLQLNGLMDIEEYVVSLQQQEKDGTTAAVGLPWRVKNGYIEATYHAKPLKAFNQLLLKQQVLNNHTLCNEIISRLRIGIQEDTDVTDKSSSSSQTNEHKKVTQTYNSAISINYSRYATSTWEPLAKLILDGTYEATLLIAIIKGLQLQLSVLKEEKKITYNNNSKKRKLRQEKQKQQNRPIVLLTKVGGGVFGNDDLWIRQSMLRAIETIQRTYYTIPLDIRIVHFREIDPFYMTLEKREKK